MTSVFVLQCVAIVAVWAFVVIYAVIHHDPALLAMAALIFPPWSFLSFEGLVIGAGFGLKGYLGGKVGLTMSGTANTNTDVKLDVAESIKAIEARRDPAKGTEDSGRVLQVHHD